MAANTVEITVLLLFSLINASLGVVSVDLNGVWQISNENRGHQINGTVPGTVHLALYQNKMIQDPYYRNNDAKYRWIGLDDWTYTRKFQVSTSVFNSKRVILVADGLDTFSTVYINGQSVGVSDNMYMRYEYDIKNVIKNGTNTIEVKFRSAVKEAEKLAKASSYNIPPDCKDPAQHGECHVQFIRKAQCSFSWDWGPSFPVQGIWLVSSLDVELSYKNNKLHMSYCYYLDSNNTWSVDVEVYFDVIKGSVTGSLETVLDTTPPIRLVTDIKLTNVENGAKYTINVPKDTPVDLWWPNGYGKQSLYKLSVNFTGNTGLKESSTRTIKIGFRTVEIVQDPVSLANKTYGLSFFYKVNDVPVFFKGTNWIPSDSFLERVTDNKIYALLKSAAEVHINSMRVWGGGVYETDYFYQLADELGIMIWSDFMFSVALYPTNTAFLLSVTIETRQQIRRLKYHPCIAVWAGNNENELGLRQGWYGVKAVDPYKSDYIKLYITTIGNVVKQEDKTRQYLSSSPSDGVYTKQQGGIAQNPASEFYGDVHYYNYINDLWNWETYQIPRFASEYGAQSWCNYETVEKVFEADDLDYWSDMAEWRQHHGLGNIEMIVQAMLHFKLPNSSNRQQRFDDLIYITQIHQAMAMKVETEHYRRLTNELFDDGRGLTMGALYWQLNDIWQAPTWASIDYDLKWKMIHYYARHFFTPNLISPFVNGSNLNIYMVNDEIPNDVHRTQNDLQGLEFRAVNDLKQLQKTSGLIFEKDLESVLNEGKCTDKKKCFLYFYLNSKSHPVSVNWLPLSYFTGNDLTASLGLHKAQIMITDVTAISATEFNIILATNTVAPFVWINAQGISGRFSDNGFLMKDPLMQLKFTAWQPVKPDDFRDSLTVKSLMDIYH
ncbi:hypothetical protein LOTGIDRAFT_119184 [Lottia gigantea]|uniref:beta-mannosidase n=1 Tax=Lottia gigantea TaxID=225164 RepID=V3ZQC6_LOTGI|nr:hypothetical protein LOTGIDRAFT_119184 [Lottia gigantea]ESO93598.1 hypothetical protein LOTGIDRAFT_119184 [Lottia gigantea]